MRWLDGITNSMDMLFEVPRDCSPPGSCVHGISQARILEWVVVKLLSPVGLLATLWTAAGRVPCPSPSPELAQIPVHRVGDDIQPSHPLFCLLSIFPSIRVFSNESALHIRQPKYWNFRFSSSPSSEYSGLISFRICYGKNENPESQSTPRRTLKKAEYGLLPLARPRGISSEQGPQHLLEIRFYTPH